jgi:hypothetical protein
LARFLDLLRRRRPTQQQNDAVLKQCMRPPEQLPDLLPLFCCTRS